MHILDAVCNSAITVLIEPSIIAYSWRRFTAGCVMTTERGMFYREYNSDGGYFEYAIETSKNL